MKPNRYFERKHVVLTGGSSGIGRRLAVRLAEAGADVTLLARRTGPLQDTVAEMEDHRRTPGQVFRARSVDVGDRLAVEAAIAAILVEAPVDVLINNAGVAWADTIESTAPEVFEEMIRINYLGTVWASRCLIPHFKSRGQGHIANVASLAGVLGCFGYAAYAPSKFAVLGFSDVLRNELCAHHIRVTVLVPPDTDTPQLEFENRTKPPETRAISGTVRTLSADEMASCLLRGMAAGRYHVVPGLAGKFPYFAVRWFPGLLRWMIDRKVQSCARRAPAQDGSSRSAIQ
jgi:3-dehydrosphinganine reductase